MELEDTDFEPAFVGREGYLAKLENAWKSRAIFGIFGIKSVGKSRLAKEFLKRKKTELQLENDDFIIVDMKYFETTVESLNALLISALGQGQVHSANTTMIGKWKEHLVNEIRNKMKLSRVIIAFDNADGFLENDKLVHDEFLSLCVMLIKYCRGLKILVTSSIKFLFTQIRSAYSQLELLPMTKSETIQLLRQETVDIKLGDFEELLAELCEGLPKLVLMTVSELTEDDALLQPQEMVELLLKDRLQSLSREFYPADDRIADEYNNFLLRLSKVRQDQLAALKVIPGSFCAGEARNILGYEKVSTAKDQVLIPIIRRHVMTYDPQTERFNIHGILRDCLKTGRHQSNNLDKSGDFKTQSMTKDVQPGSNKHLESIRCFETSLEALSVGQVDNADTVASSEDKRVKCINNLTSNEDQDVFKECKEGGREQLFTAWNIEEEESSYIKCNNSTSFCEECGIHSLIDNTFVSERDHEYESKERKDVNPDLFAHGEAHMNELDKTSRQLMVDVSTNIETVLKESEGTWDLRNEGNVVSDGQKMDKRPDDFTGIQRPSAVSESECACAQCQELHKNFKSVKE